MKPQPPIEITSRGKVATVRLRLVRGRIDARAAQELCGAAEVLRLDESVAVVLVTSAAEDFCLGFSGEPWGTALECIAAVARLPQPVIADVRGRAWAEGCELALACDLRQVTRAASFKLPQLAEGRLPREGATQRLPRLIGATRALDILWSGRAVGAAEAVRIGLASRGAAATIAAQLAQKGPIALRLAKEAVRAASDMTLDQGVRLEQDLYVLLQTSEERAEGVRAFLEKRRPVFR